MKNTILFSLIAILFSLSIISCDDDDNDIQPQNNIDTPAKLAEALNKIIDETEVPGFAVTVVKDNAIVLQEGFGYADIEAGKPYTNQTVQHIASVSKTVAGAAVVKAIEQGLFTLESDINDLLPVELINPKQPNAVIKVKHLVSHTSGLLDNTDLYFANNYYILPGENLNTDGAQALINQLGIEQREGHTLEEFLAEYYLEDGDLYSLDNFADSAPGSTWAYSNVATGLMGFIIESVSGMPFDEYVKTQILQPLSMTQSTYDIAEVDLTNMAKWYLDKATPLPLYGNDSYVEGSIFTNNEDFGKYLLDMVNGVQGSSAALFSQDAYDLLFADQLSNGVVPSDFAENHGVFWSKEGDILKHGGNSIGVSAYIELDQAGDVGYTFMTNMDAVFNYSKYQEVAVRIDAVMKEYLSAH